MVFAGVLVRLTAQPLHFLVGQTGDRLDADVLLFACGLILGRDRHHPVRVDVELDLHLRDAAGRGENAIEDEPRQRLVVAGHRTFALQHVDLYRRLVVRGGGERLARARRDGRVALDERGHDAA